MSQARDPRRTTFKNAVPKQAAHDIFKAVEFYEQKLGFARTFVLDDYAGVARGPVEIHLWRCDDRYIAQNTACRVNVEGIEALYEEYRLSGVIHPNGALAMKPWGREGVYYPGPRRKREQSSVHRFSNRARVSIKRRRKLRELQIDQLPPKVRAVRRAMAAKSHCRNERLPIQGREVAGGLYLARP